MLVEFKPYGKGAPVYVKTARILTAEPYHSGETDCGSIIYLDNGTTVLVGDYPRAVALKSDKVISRFVNGALLITRERNRQLIEEGHSTEQDDQYKNGALAMAGIVYATVASVSPELREEYRQVFKQGQRVHHWPWDGSNPKLEPKDDLESRIKELTKAGALIAAEIDKLQRKLRAQE
ncbi:hypothetical protein [Pseudoalteromonas piscicida]|uniref:hypothetical protein n=1 Tax=Pseudoalteromonas piscicida TaxID=43662 RepID=UPI0018D59645|nr:hypothetical protein [Pseudoalteromonas piscicida]